jgi:hypothetical protein
MKITWQTPIHASKAVWSKIKRVVRREPLTVPVIEQERRKGICRSCDKFIQRTSQCSICTCFIDLKVVFADEKCEAQPRKW